MGPANFLFLWLHNSFGVFRSSVFGGARKHGSKDLDIFFWILASGL